MTRPANTGFRVERNSMVMFMRNVEHWTLFNSTLYDNVCICSCTKLICIISHQTLIVLKRHVMLLFQVPVGMCKKMQRHLEDTGRQLSGDPVLEVTRVPQQRALQFWLVSAADGDGTGSVTTGCTGTKAFVHPSPQTLGGIRSCWHWLQPWTCWSLAFHLVATMYRRMCTGWGAEALAS